MHSTKNGFLAIWRYVESTAHTNSYCIVFLLCSYLRYDCTDMLKIIFEIVLPCGITIIHTSITIGLAIIIFQKSKYQKKN